MKDKFPIEEIINYRENRYELVQACIKRAYQMVIRDHEERVLLEKSPTVPVAKPGKLKQGRAAKISAMAMSDVLRKKVKMYTENSEEN